MEISIKLELDAEQVLLEESLRKTEEVVLDFQKELIYEIVTKRFSDQYIKRQKRLNALKSPFIKVREILQEVLGENIEKINTQEYIDTTPVDVEKKNTRKNLSCLSYEESINYLVNVNKHGLRKTNSSKEY